MIIIQTHIHPRIHTRHNSASTHLPQIQAYMYVKDTTHNDDIYFYLFPLFDMQNTYSLNFCFHFFTSAGSSDVTTADSNENMSSVSPVRALLPLSQSPTVNDSAANLTRVPSAPQNMSTLQQQLQRDDLSVRRYVHICQIFKRVFVSSCFFFSIYISLPHLSHFYIYQSLHHYIVFISMQ